MDKKEIITHELGMDGTDRSRRRLSWFSLGMFNEVVGEWLWVQGPRMKKNR